jgi:dipeptidyl aminopeptidase/acylaminoacyl peptidase
MNRVAPCINVLFGLATIALTAAAASPSGTQRRGDSIESVPVVAAAANAGSQSSANEIRTNAVVSAAMVILKKNCLSCHNSEKKKGDLILESRASLLKGGENGPVVVPGKASESRLAQFLLPDADPHMPPKKQLSDEEIGTLRVWIDGGVAWDEKALAETPAPSNPVRLRPLPASYQPVLAVALSNEGKRMAIGRGGEISIYEVGMTNHSISGKLDAHHDAVQTLAWSPNGKWLVSGAYRRIAIWDAESMKQSSEITNLVGRVTAIEFMPDSSTLVVADGIETRSGVIHLWTMGEPDPKVTWTAHADTVLDLKVSADGMLLASAGVDKLVKLWELPSGKEIARLEGHSGHVLAVAFKPDGSMVASGGADKEIKVWDVKTKEQKKTIGRHPAPVTDLVWTVDGKKIISACEDGAVRLCEETKDNPEKTISGGSDILYGIAVSPDGKVVYAGCHDGLVYVWETGGKLREKLGSPVGGKKLAEK